MARDFMRCPGCGVIMDLGAFAKRPDEVICPRCNTQSAVPPLTDEPLGKVRGQHANAPASAQDVAERVERGGENNTGPHEAAPAATAPDGTAPVVAEPAGTAPAVTPINTPEPAAAPAAAARTEPVAHADASAAAQASAAPQGEAMRVLAIDERGNSEPLAFAVIGCVATFTAFPLIGLFLCIAALMMNAEETGHGFVNSHAGAAKAFAILGIVLNCLVLVLEVLAVALSALAAGAYL